VTTVAVTGHEGFAQLEIQRVEALNALNRQVLDDLEAAWVSLEADEDLAAVLITGAGSRAFVAGADIQEIHELPSAHAARDFARRGQAVFQRIAESRLISVAAIQGFALGGGLELAMAADFRLLAQSAQVGQPEIGLGVIPGFGGTQRLTRLVGEARALDLVLTGRRIDAETALAWGLAQRVVPSDDLIPAAMDLCRQLAALPRLALELAKKAVRRGGDMPLPLGLDFEATLFGLAASHADAREGTAAFLERRPPRFGSRPEAERG
jgi:enoyl-CoA hydratase